MTQIADDLGRIERRLAAAAMREHDKRVEEYIELEKLLPTSHERAALRIAATTLEESGHGYVAEFLSAYGKRLEKAGY